MADPYVPLPDDDESVDSLTADFDDYMRAAVPGWEPSDGALEVAIRAAFADEASTLYALVRERFTDEFRTYGSDVLGIAPQEAVPASTTTTWTARDALGPYTIEAGTTIVIDAPEGPVAFEVLNETTIASGATVAAGVLVQALVPGASANGVTGPVLFDQQPAWVLSVSVTSPAAGGADAEDDDAYLDRIRRGAQQLSRAPILPRDFELAAQEIDEVARALVRDGYDDTTSLDNQERTVSIYPVTATGDPVSSGGKAAVAALIEARREVNWVVRVADPTYTTVNIDITVSAEEGSDSADVQARVAAHLAATTLNPAIWGQPSLGEQRTFKRRTVLRRYEVAASADTVQDVYDVQSVHLSTGSSSTTDADVTLAGSAPLPRAGTINVTVVAPT